MKSSLVNQVRPTPTEIKAWCKNTVASSTQGTPVFSGWDSKIWGKPYNEIVEFMMDRFKRTLSEPEYYLSILFLTKSIEKENLFVPFKLSPQYQDMLKTSGIGTNVLPSPMALKQTPFSIKLSRFGVKIG